VTFNGGTISAQGGYGIGGQPSGGDIAFGAVTLANAATVVTTGPTGGNIAFNGPVNGAQALSLVAGTGTVTLGGQFGGTTPLTTLSVLSGATTISGSGVITSGNQTYVAPVTVTGSATLTSKAAGSLSFGSTVDGPGSLTLATTGTTTFSGTVGGTTPLASLQTAAGTTSIAAAGITTSGNQKYGGALQLAAPTVTLKGDTGIFTSGVAGGGNSLVLDFSGTTTIDGTFAGLQNLTTQGGGTTTIDGAVTTSGTQTYLDAVSLLGNATLTGTTVTTGSTLTGGGNSLDIIGNAVIGGNVAAVTNLAVSGTTTLSAASVATTGTQKYGGLVTLGTNTTLSGTTPTFSGGVAGGGHDLTLDFSGTTTIAGETFTGIRDLVTHGGGTTALSGPLVTSGSQTFREAVSLIGATALEGTRIDFEAALDGARNLALAATAGPVNFAAAVGGTTRLGSLAITKATAVNAADRIVLSGAAAGANRTGLTIGAGVNNVNLTKAGNKVTGFVGNGVVLQGGSRASTFANFAISGNGQSGFLVQAGDSAGTTIRDNTVSGNGFNGIWLNGAVPSVSVTANTLNNNNNNGIVVSGPATGITISNNTVTGSGLTGIRTEVVAGQSTTGLTISGNTTHKNQENGIIVSGGTGTTVTDNKVSDNRLQGVVLTLGASGTRVQNNQIFRNGAIGVVVSGPTTVGNSILSNSIHSNLGGGIALLQQANRNQVAPVLKSARLAGGRITIAGSIRGRVGDVVRIQFFSNLPSDAANARGVQGRTLIGFRDVRLTKATTAINSTFSAAGIPANSWISATATLLVGGEPSDSSQFSLGVRAR
jgi:parallel beta-helix repeat protein